MNTTLPYEGNSIDAFEAELERQVGSLRDELREAWLDLLEMVPDEAQNILTSYRTLKTREEMFAWLNSVAEQVIEKTQPKPAREMSGLDPNSSRAFCPLCGGSSQGFFGELGFVHPEGLRRHLRGDHNARQCRVMKAAERLARESVRGVRSFGWRP